MGALPIEENAVSRAKKIELESGAFVRLCTAEGLLVMKAFAYSPQDWCDIRGILLRQATLRVDCEYVLRELGPLCEVKEAPEIMEQLGSPRSEVAATEP